MSSTHRAPSQIPANGTYVVTSTIATATTGAYDGAGTASTLGGGGVAAGSILYDMGKTVYLPPTNTNKGQVLRKVQVAPFESNTGFQTFYIRIGGGDAATTNPVARL